MGGGGADHRPARRQLPGESVHHGCLSAAAGQRRHAGPDAQQLPQLHAVTSCVILL